MSEGPTGFLLMTPGERRPFFRQYAEDGSFVDYVIRHSDLEIRILGEHHLGVDKNGTPVLDHSPEVLGHDEA